MQQNSFIFHKSFFDAIKNVNKKIQNEIFTAICRFVFENEEPELSGWSKRIFALIRPQLEKNVKENKKGGDVYEG